MRKTCDLVTQGLSRSRGRALVDMEFRELLFEVGTTWLPNFLSRSTRRELVEMEFRELLFQVGKRGERTMFNDRK